MGGILDFLCKACRRLEIGTSAHEINELATVVEALPQQHPLVTLLRGSRDALNADVLADALLNPRDQSYYSTHRSKEQGE